MSPNEVRHSLITALLQATEPWTLQELLSEAGLPLGDALPALRRLVGEGQVVEGHLLPEKPAPQYRWATRWEAESRRRAGSARQGLRAGVEQAGPAAPETLDLEGPAARAFCRYVLEQYRPPEGKRFLAIFQCSVRRPFSHSPSHASLRRAVRAATGFDPAGDFARCPVHVVVLASRIGPVPYELEEVYPANVGGGGVKHFSEETYARHLPILAGRMAAYLRTHRASYDRVATFTEGRYAEVMLACRERLRRDCPDPLPIRILPVPGGAEVTRIGKSVPRPYWQRFWIQLFLEIFAWLPPEARAAAGARLAEMEVEYVAGDGGCGTGDVG
jgi:hypothetical protein